MTSKYKVYEIGYEGSHNYTSHDEDPWRILIAVPEGMNVQKLRIASHITCEFRPDFDERTPGVDFLLYDSVSS